MSFVDDFKKQRVDFQIYCWIFGGHIEIAGIVQQNNNFKCISDFVFSNKNVARVKLFHPGTFIFLIDLSSLYMDGTSYIKITNDFPLTIPTKLQLCT